jgi:hypothetical protein
LLFRLITTTLFKGKAIMMDDDIIIIKKRVLYPSSPEYKDLMLEPCKEGDSIESTFECLNCGEMNKIYWDKDHALFLSASNR